MKLIPPDQKQRARNLRNNATPAERRLWCALRNNQLEGFKFSRQIAIGPFIADLVCRKQWLVIEIDGGQHGGQDDLDRQHFIEREGYRVLRFWNAQVLRDTDMVVGIIARALRGGETHPRPLPLAGGEQRPTPPVPGGGKEHTPRVPGGQKET
jgi:very-short-patch-repair endonuclease